jgi:hypothetical protein
MGGSEKRNAVEAIKQMSPDRGRYSKVSRRIWNSPSFRSLTPPKPCGAWLFFRLLTGPELSNIPGLFQAWESGLAEALRWPLKDFRKAFQEVFDGGMAQADWSVGLIWLPSAINHNEPESVNVVIGWRTAWQELPECELKDRAGASLMAWATAKGEAWAKAFAKATGKASLETTPIQKQKQKQEQEQEQKQSDPSAAQEPSPDEAFAMHNGWRPSPEVVESFRVAMIPDWAIEPMISRHRSSFVGKKSDLRTQEKWDESCSKWVHGDWNNPQKRPKKPVAETKSDETGGYGNASEWAT